MAEDGGGFAAGAEGGFKRKLGPLEVWQWGAGVVGLFALYFAYRSYRGGGAATTGATATTTPSVSTVPPSDTATTGAQTAVTGQLDNITRGLSGLSAQVAAVPQAVLTAVPALTAAPTAVQANPTPGSSSGATGGLANWQAFEASPAALSLADTNQSAYVTAQYQSVLGRAPDTGGAAFWEKMLGSNPTQAQVTAENQAFLGATGPEIAARQATTGQ